MHVAIYVRDTLTVESLFNHNCEFECLWIKINLRKARSSINSMYVGVCYFPPNAPYSKDLLEHIQKTVDDIRSYDYSALIAILGDFNDLPTDTLTEDLLLAQMVQFPTLGSATLDKIFTNNSDLFNPPVCMALFDQVTMYQSWWLLSTSFLSRRKLSRLGHIATYRSDPSASGLLNRIGTGFFLVLKSMIL